MKISSFLNRFKATKTVQVSAAEDTEPMSAKSRRVPPIKKSELTTLFHSVLEEKRDDLPAGRK